MFVKTLQGAGDSAPISEHFAVTVEIVSAITSSLVLDEVLANVVRRTAEVLDLWECDIYEYRPAESVSVCQALYAREPHPADEAWVGSTLKLAEQPAFRRVLRDSHMIATHIDDPALPDADRARMEYWGEKSCLHVPLIFKDEVIGCLELVEKRRLRRFTKRECELASTLAALAAVAIQNARLYGNVELLAITDGLTGLYNHRHFYDRLAQEVARAQRYQLPLSLLMIDIDDFKRYNDRFGHRAGDALLHELGDLLQSQTRQQVDQVARYGGEEFAITLPSTGTAGAARAGERLRETISASGSEGGLRLEEAGSKADEDPGPNGGSGAARAVAERIRSSVENETFGAAQQPPVVTVSAGVATLPHHATTVDGLVEEADHALYRAKELGKNRVEVARAQAEMAP